MTDQPLLEDRPSPTEARPSVLASPTLPLPPPREVNRGEPIERQVPVEEETLVTLRVPPRAICQLYHPGNPDRRLQLDADDRGIVRVHATAKVGAQPTELLLEYQHDGQGWRQSVTISADLHCTPEMSAPELADVPVVTGSVRPPLEGDVAELSTRELVARGYPPRPDPAKAPARYARWLRTVSRPSTVVSPRIVAHPELSHAPDPAGQNTAEAIPGTGQPGSEANANWSTWCGAYVNKPTGQFYNISATWTVPASVPFGEEFAAVVEWIGLDNFAGDLYQAGTGALCLDIAGFWQITSYFMWMESLPWSWWVVPNFPVSPGDQLTVDIWVADPYGTTEFKDPTEGNDGLTRADNSVWFYLVSSNGASFMGTYPTAPESLGGLQSTGFTGRTAEFIIERPQVNGASTPLAFFTPTLMRACSYGDALYGDWEMFFLQPDNGSEPFDGNLQYLNMVDPANNDTLAVPFVLPDPAENPSANMIMFAWLDWL
jgi:Peptidase A4 family